jgi:hypothetical protein
MWIQFHQFRKAYKLNKKKNMGGYLVILVWNNRSLFFNNQVKMNVAAINKG